MGEVSAKASVGLTSSAFIGLTQAEWEVIRRRIAAGVSLEQIAEERLQVLEQARRKLAT